MQTDNPYSTPNAPVSDILSDDGVGEINIFTAKGRLGRVRYFYYSVLISLVGMALIGGAALLLNISPTIAGILIAIIYIALIVISFFILIQRCHDLDLSGWWCLLSLIPLAILYFLFAPGTKTANRFGFRPPKNSKGVIFAAIILPVILVVLLGIVSAITTPALQAKLQEAQGQIQEAQDAATPAE